MGSCRITVGLLEKHLVLSTVTANKSLGIEKIGAQLTRKYKISPALKKEIANILNA